jgi:hypothetical protein
VSLPRCRRTKKRTEKKTSGSVSSAAH